MLVSADMLLYPANTERLTMFTATGMNASIAVRAASTMFRLLIA